LQQGLRLVGAGGLAFETTPGWHAGREVRLRGLDFRRELAQEG